MGVRVGRRMVGMRGDGAGGWCEVGGILAAGTDGTGLLLRGVVMGGASRSETRLSMAVSYRGCRFVLRVERR